MIRGARPTLSVVVPSYNHARFVRQALESVLVQDYRPLELVVVDDGSTDDSVGVIRATIADHRLDSVRFERQDNRGAHHAINRGLELASGEYLTVLNSDDVYDASRLHRLMSRAAEAGAGVVFSGVRFIDEHGAPLAVDSAWPAWYGRGVAETEDLPTVGFRLLVHNLSVTSGNFLFSRQLLEGLRGFCGHRFAHDWDFLLRSTYLAEPVLVAAPLLSYRVHGGNTTEQVRQLMKEECGASIEAYARLLRSPSPNPLAPCRANWPRYFDRFLATRAPFFCAASAYRDLAIDW